MSLKRRFGVRFLSYFSDQRIQKGTEEQWIMILITQGVMGRTATSSASQPLLYLKYRLHFASSTVVFSPLHEFSNDPF